MPFRRRNVCLIVIFRSGLPGMYLNPLNAMAMTQLAYPIASGNAAAGYPRTLTGKTWPRLLSHETNQQNVKFNFCSLSLLSQ